MHGVQLGFCQVTIFLSQVFYIFEHGTERNIFWNRWFNILLLFYFYFLNFVLWYIRFPAPVSLRKDCWPILLSKKTKQYIGIATISLWSLNEMSNISRQLVIIILWKMPNTLSLKLKTCHRITRQDLCEIYHFSILKLRALSNATH